MQASRSLFAAAEPATCMPAHCFCEAIRSTPPLQPANAWSSLAFCIVAVGVVAVARRDRGRGGQQSYSQISARSYSSIFALALLLIGVGSFAFHSRLTLQTQFADVFGMYLIATFVIVFGLRRRKLSISTLMLLYVALNAVLAYVLYAAPEARRYLFAVTILAGVIIEYRGSGHSTNKSGSRYLHLAVSALAIGFIIWVIDITRVICAPYSWLQGHAIWHVMGAAAAGLIFLYYRFITHGITRQ